MAKVAFKLGDSYGKEKRGYLASSRIRGHWVAKYWNQADDIFYKEEFPTFKDNFFDTKTQLHLLRDYDVVIINKTYEHALAGELLKQGKKVIVDLCDPDWLLSHSSVQRSNDCLKTLKNATCAVVNGEEMKEELKKVFNKPIYIIPDRMDFNSYPVRKEKHRDKIKSLVWYGYNENLRVLEPYLTGILEMDYEITIISDKFFEGTPIITSKDPSKYITFKVWHPETVNEQIIKHDIVFIGHDPDPDLRKWKSNNRALTGYALGMPVAYTLEDLMKLKTKESRIIDVKRNYQLAREQFDVRRSVDDYKKIIKEIL